MLARRQIQQTGLYETLWEKWDLYIPFIERGYKLLRKGGIITFIVSDAFCHAQYARVLQNWFLKHACVLRLDFFSKIKIFEAGVHNITFFFQKTDGTGNIPDRRVHYPAVGQVTVLPSDKQENLTYRVFFPEGPEPNATFTTKMVSLKDICYTTYGLRPNSDNLPA